MCFYFLYKSTFSAFKAIYRIYPIPTTTYTRFVSVCVKYVFTEELYHNYTSPLQVFLFLSEFVGVSKPKTKPQTDPQGLSTYYKLFVKPTFREMYQCLLNPYSTRLCGFLPLFNTFSCCAICTGFWLIPSTTDRLPPSFGSSDADTETLFTSLLTPGKLYE